MCKTKMNIWLNTVTKQTHDLYPDNECLHSANAHYPSLVENTHLTRMSLGIIKIIKEDNILTLNKYL